MTNALVEVRDLTVGWPDAAPLLERVSFDVHRGEIFAILGGSGVGKSTLMRCLVGLEDPVEGTINIAGEGPPRLDAERPKFGVMFQHGALLGSMSLAENVALPLQRWARLPREAVLGIARAKLRLVGLGPAAKKPPSEISGGMTKRAAIARAMALEPPLLFLDEPSSGLDPITSADLDLLITELRGVLELTVVVVTHELASIFAIADRCIMLDADTRGIIAHGDPRELKASADPRVSAFFNRTARGL